MSDAMSSVLVFLEAKNNEISRISWEAMAAAHTLAEGLGLPVDVAIIANRDNPMLATIHGKPPRTVYAIDHTLLHGYTADGYTAACAQLVHHAKPAYVVFPHTYQVRDFAPKLATRLKQVLISDVTGIGTGNPPTFVRQLLQGKLNAEYHHVGNGVCFLSVQAGAFRADSAVPGETTIEPFHPSLEATQIRVQPGEPFRASAQTVDLNSASILVSVGRGIKEQANLPIVEELAAAPGGQFRTDRGPQGLSRRRHQRGNSASCRHERLAVHRGHQ